MDGRCSRPRARQPLGVSGEADLRPIRRAVDGVFRRSTCRVDEEVRRPAARVVVNPQAARRPRMARATSVSAVPVRCHGKHVQEAPRAVVRPAYRCSSGDDGELEPAVRAIHNEVALTLAERDGVRPGAIRAASAARAPSPPTSGSGRDDRASPRRCGRPGARRPAPGAVVLRGDASPLRRARRPSSDRDRDAGVRRERACVRALQGRLPRLARGGARRDSKRVWPTRGARGPSGLRLHALAGGGSGRRAKPDAQTTPERACLGAARRSFTREQNLPTRGARAHQLLPSSAPGASHEAIRDLKATGPPHPAPTPVAPASARLDLTRFGRDRTRRN